MSVRRPMLSVRLMSIVAILACALLFNIAMGAVDIAWREVFTTPHNMTSEELETQRLLISLRAVHAATALLVGAGLAVVGSVLQRLLRNPLGDPFVLGVTSGGTLAAVAAIIANLPFLFIGVPVRILAALVGSLFSLGLMMLGRRWLFKGNDTYGVPVAGMMLNALFGALLMLVLVFAKPDRLGEAQRWLMGDIQPLAAKEVAVAALFLSIGTALLVRLAPAIGALAFGEEFATSIGFNAKRYQKIVLLVAAAVTAVVVSMAGSVGFVGLIVPHFARWLLPGHLAAEWLGSACLGGILVLLADALARTVAAPAELPVGVFTALIGVPTLCLMALRARGGARAS